MDPSQGVIFTAVLTVAAICCVGALLRRVEWLTEEADRSLLNLTLKALLPCLIFDVIVGNPQLLRASNVVFPPLVGYGTATAGFALAWLVARQGGAAMWLDDDARKRTFAFAAGLHNYGFIPIPLVEFLFRENPKVRDATMGVLLVHNVGVEMAVWTVGVLVLAGTMGRGWWKSIINPASIVIVLALGTNFLGLDGWVPDFARKAIHMLGQASVPMSLLLVGATAADYLNLGLRRGGRIILAGSLIRLAIMPAGFLLLAYLAPFSVELKRVIVIEAAMPSAMISIVMARHYHGDPPTALRVSLGTSLVALLTIPLWLHGGFALLHLTQGR